MTIEELCAMRDEAIMSNLSQKTKEHMYAHFQDEIVKVWNKTPVK